VPEGAGVTPTSLPGPDASQAVVTATWGHGDEGKVMFHRDALTVRQIHGRFGEPGPGAIWVKLATSIVAGEQPTAAQRAVVAADFCNGISSRLTRGWVFMNSDLTVHLGRHPAGEWVALDADSMYHDLGRGLAWGTLWDTTAWVGRSTQTLFLDHA
jgi:hypothetical protein